MVALEGAGAPMRRDMRFIIDIVNELAPNGDPLLKVCDILAMSAELPVLTPRNLSAMMIRRSGTRGPWRASVWRRCMGIATRNARLVDLLRERDQSELIVCSALARLCHGWPML